jgi:hypothetical protein
MGLLERGIVEQLLELTPKEKQDNLEPKILKLLGGVPNTSVSKLPPRRGKADGGLDGRVAVLVPSALVDPGSNSGEVVDAEAAINIKVEKDKFSRTLMGAFINDMDREGIKVGIIVTTAGLSPDARSEKIVLVHYLLEELISGDPADKGISFKNGTLGETIKKNLVDYLASEKGKAQEENATA